MQAAPLRIKTATGARKAFALAALCLLAACAAPPVSDPTPGRQLQPISGNVSVLGASPYSGVSQMGGTPALRPAASGSTAQGAQAFPTVPSSPGGEELAYVRSILADMQRESFASGRETCGYLGRDASGALMVTTINVGTEASCYLPAIPAGMRIAASIHTHGTYSPRYASEFPTVQDMTTDAQDRINGYISTPGGRLWYVDSGTMTVRQLCGRGCLPQDPNYRPEDDGPVRPSYTINELRAWESGY